MRSLNKWIARFLICLLMNLSHIPIARAQNVTRDVSDKTRLSLSESYFRHLKSEEAKLEALNKDYVELDLECRVKTKDCGFDLTPKSFTYILLSGVVLGFLIGKK